MFKKRIVAGALSFAALAVSFSVSAASNAEQELVDYLTSIGMQDSVSWERIKGNSLSDATLYGVTYISDKGTEDEKKYLIKQVDFDDYTLTDDKASVAVKYKGATDEDGVHVFLSQKLQPQSHFRGLGYEQLDDLEVKLSYVMEKAAGALEGKVEVDQSDVLEASFDFKTEGLDMLIGQLASLDVATLDPNLIMLSAMATKIHKLNLTLEDDGYNKRLLAHKPDHQAEVEGQYQGCMSSVGEFGLQELEQGCAAIRDYLLNKEDKLRIAINPEKPFSVGEYMPMFMLVGSAGPEAAGSLVKRILNEINLKISN